MTPGPRRRGGLRAAVLVAAALGALAVAVLPVGPPASAADAPRVMVSGDGRTWEARLDSSLFGPDLLLVPGGSTTGTFWVKNVAGDAAVLDARLVDVTVSSAAFASELSVSASSVVGEGTVSGPPALVATGSCGALVAPVPLPDGDAATITVDVALAASAAEGTAGQSVAFGVLVTLRDASPSAVPAVTDACPPRSSSSGPEATVVTGVPGSSGAAASRPGAADAAVPLGELVPDGPQPAPAGSSARAAADAVDGAPLGGVPGPAEPFVAVALRSPWIPLVVAALALLAGAFVAVDRRRRDADET